MLIPLTLLHLQFFCNGWEWKHKFNARPGSRAVVNPKHKTSLVNSFSSVLLQFPASKHSLINEVPAYSLWLLSGGISSGCQRFAQSDFRQAPAFTSCWSSLSLFCLRKEIFSLHKKEFTPGLFLFGRQYFSSDSPLANAMD